MKKIFLLTFAFIFSTSILQAEDLPPLPKGPLMLTSATRAMQSPQFWIRRIPNAEKTVKTPAGIKKFNNYIRSLVKENKDIFKLDRVRPGKQISDQLKLEFSTLRNRKLFDIHDKYFKKSFFDEKIKPLLQIDKVPSRIKMQWGVAVRSTSVRALPTMVKMVEEKRDFEFDQLQFTRIKLWTPVGIFHKSSDGKWLYVQAPYVRGWVKAKDIAIFPSRKELKKYVGVHNFLVVVGESAKVYKEPSRLKVLQRPTMGAVLPLVGDGGVTTRAPNYTVWMPYRKSGGAAGLAKAHVKKKSNVSPEFPVYSQANIIRQAFKLLGARYGWGGQYKGRDCSGFVQDVFMSFGIAMPRDSKQQAQIGIQLGFFNSFEDEAERKQILNAARPGLTLLKMPTHQMLYIGKANNRYYIIHSTWAERTGYDRLLDEKRRINQVVVSDLTLNGDSYIGPLFHRIVSINEID